MSAGPLLQVQNLSLTISGKLILKSISFAIEAGKVLGLVGESGSGKSITAYSLIRLLPAAGEISGRILFAGEDITLLEERAMCSLRGAQIAMVFQEPMTALNPLQSIGVQVAEVFEKHQGMSRAEGLLHAAETLQRVGLPPAQISLTRYPFELSGGQRQRVVIAIALALKPKLLIVDEPTTALDVTTEAQILDLLQSLCTEENIAMLFVSHDLAAVARLSDHIAIMQNGEIVESGSTTELFATMRHPYSLGLRAASHYRPSVERQNIANIKQTNPILEVKNLSRDYRLPGKWLFDKADTFRALENINLVLYKGESVGLVGESGSGKSTLVRAILGLEALQAGTVMIDGKPFSPAPPSEQMALRNKIQVVFQDPYGSFNPRHKVARIVAEPLSLLAAKLSKADRLARVTSCLQSVGLNTDDIHKYPHEFSGGQRQRIAIARALIVSPSIVILDEATSALDVSVRAQILELLADLSQRLGLSYLFVSHDLDVVRSVTDRVIILKAGKVVEQGDTAQIFASPQHPYTQSLIGSKPSLQDEIDKRISMEQTHVG